MNKNFTSQDMEAVIDVLNGYLQYLKFKWDQENISGSFWTFSKTYLMKVSNFITNALDETVRLVENLIPGGENKKIAVMSTMENILDYIIIQTFPVWAKPFIPIIKKFVLNVLVSNFIDFIVSKYNAGLWGVQESKPKPEVNVDQIQKSPEIFVPPIQETQFMQEATYVPKRKRQKKLSK
jgi:hypothetical protein